ncbi:unnamed protein product [Clonostachys rosea f. rosea IK726]|uniref:6-phosphogluconate dehydrogenase NADP-binding domain-containing protein n=2 Tax=Bionectria ochroleuca TaxID=29856 RepID=A0A0B7KL38_BIOOC|nr:unnamed protein product [Clonostachys rosea f. rosea IK726]
MSPTNSTYPQVGFIGLGAMGFAMSLHLVGMGFPVTAYDVYQPALERWRDECRKIANAQARVASCCSEAVESASVVCLMVATHDHLHSALFDKDTGAIHKLPQDCAVIIHATIPLEQPSIIHERLVNEFKRPDIALIDAPVSGGVARSTNGTLVIMASCGEPSLSPNAASKTTLEALASEGRTLYIIPGSLGRGQAAKALNQVMCGIHIVSASEIMGLAAIQGLDTQKFYRKLISKESNGNQVPGWSWMLENRGPRILSTNPPLASAISIINKDIGIIRSEENRVGITLSLLDAAGEVITAAMKTLASADDSFIVQHYFQGRNLVVDRVGNPMVAEEQCDTVMSQIAHAHVVIHLISAYETIRFACALGLTGSTERKQWYNIIAGAAGGSTIFTEVIPRAFEDIENIDGVFKTYTLEKFPGILSTTSFILEEANRKGFASKLLEVAHQKLTLLLDL